MDDSFSRTGLIYGMALVLAIGKACTLLIWRTLPKPRPPVRQELAEAWRRRRTRMQVDAKAASAPQDPHPVANDGMADTSQTENMFRPSTSAPGQALHGTTKLSARIAPP
ncbi:hypothetical protein [Microvirga pakistanensis]|uniref:hypothetical protein n=1 Tax=Microvirga pakistanensis TaxID=1682650 RepID=UPI00106BD521|nr:hypothetical protein [Microvirga pakistanensis]